MSLKYEPASELLHISEAQTLNPTSGEELLEEERREQDAIAPPAHSYLEPLDPPQSDLEPLDPPEEEPGS